MSCANRLFEMVRKRIRDKCGRKIKHARGRSLNPLNPLNPKIKIQILISYPYTFSVEVAGRIC